MPRATFLPNEFGKVLERFDIFEGRRVSPRGKLLTSVVLHTHIVGHQIRGAKVWCRKLRKSSDNIDGLSRSYGSRGRIIEGRRPVTVTRGWRCVPLRAQLFNACHPRATRNVKVGQGRVAPRRTRLTEDLASRREAKIARHESRRISTERDAESE